MNLLIKKIITGPFQENCFIIINKEVNSAILIDPGDDEIIIDNFIKNNNLKPKAIINTHSHLDHIGAINFFQEKYKIDFYLHINEEMILDGYKESCMFFGIEPKKKPIVDHWLDNETILNFKDFKLKTFNTPGHTPGGVCILIDNFLFVGDTLFSGSIGRTDLPGGDWSTLESSLKHLYDSLPLETIVHPGHGPDTTLLAELNGNPYLKFLSNY